MDEITSSPEKTPHRDRSARSAALWATLIALPVTLAVAGFTFAKLSPSEPAATPSASATAFRPQSTAPVELPAPALAERPAVVCRALVSRLPDRVRDLRQRPVTAGAEQNAAYGDPALTVSCGAEAAVKPCPSPTAGGRLPDGCFPETDEVWSVNRVCWHPTQEADATVLTAVDREVPIQVRVPKEYAQPLQWVTPISDAIVSAVPSARSAPSGCSA